MKSFHWGFVGFEERKDSNDPDFLRKVGDEKGTTCERKEQRAASLLTSQLVFHGFQFFEEPFHLISFPFKTFLKIKIQFSLRWKKIIIV